MNGKGMLEVTLYTKAGCHLCDDLLESLQDLQVEMAFHIVERDIEDNADDFARFRYLIPVLEVPGADLLYPPHDMVEIRQAILTANIEADSRP